MCNGINDFLAFNKFNVSRYLPTPLTPITSTGNHAVLSLQVLQKVGDAIRLAPPILPPESEPDGGSEADGDYDE